MIWKGKRYQLHRSTFLHLRVEHTCRRHAQYYMQVASALINKIAIEFWGALAKASLFGPIPDTFQNVDDFIFCEKVWDFAGVQNIVNILHRCNHKYYLTILIGKNGFQESWNIPQGMILPSIAYRWKERRYYELRSLRVLGWLWGPQATPFLYMI